MENTPLYLHAQVYSLPEKYQDQQIGLINDAIRKNIEMS